MGRQFAAQLVERFASLLGGAPLGQLRLLSNDTDDQQDDGSGGNQNGGQEQRDSTRTSPIISGRLDRLDSSRLS
ncbi:MAG TPA: hypothetical protein VFB85_12065 [Vicinamibacterales bacterium]|nr:hypothetical protein [Vicinamibacterales bacterium]